MKHETKPSEIRQMLLTSHLSGTTSKCQRDEINTQVDTTYRFPCFLFLNKIRHSVKYLRLH